MDIWAQARHFRAENEKNHEDTENTEDKREKDSFPSVISVPLWLDILCTVLPARGKEEAMRSLIGCLVGVAIILSAGIVQSQPLEEYVKKAEDYQKSGKLEQALKAMEEAVEKHPDDPAAYSYLGLYLGMQAGKTSDFMEAGRLVGRSFEMLDKAVSLDPHNPFARYHRGLMGVNVPKFLGKLESGIKDLESLIDISEQSPDKVSGDMLVSAYDMLGQGYQKNKEKQKAKLAWEKVIELAPGTDLAKKAEGNIETVSEAKQPPPRRQPESATITSLKQKTEKEPGNTTSSSK